MCSCDAMQSPKRLKCLTIDELFNRQLQRNEGTINCPVCKVKVKKSYINSHLDNDCILEYESKEDKPKWDSGDNNKSGSNTGIIKEDDRLLSRDVGTQENENFSPYFQSSGINNIIGDTDVEIISVKRKLSLTSKKKAAFVSKKRTTSDVAHDTAFLDINDYCRTVIEESSEILDVNVSQVRFCM